MSMSGTIRPSPVLLERILGKEGEGLCEAMCEGGGAL